MTAKTDLFCSHASRALGKELRTGEWLNLDGNCISEDGNDNASSPLAKKAIVQGTWVTSTSTLDSASLVSPI
jgi:hypothetical protein